jgi:hypothetical protein
MVLENPRSATMVKLTPEQRREIAQAGEQPVRMEDPETHAAYVILKEEVYRRMEELLSVEKVDRSLYEFGDFHPVK